MIDEAGGAEKKGSLVSDVANETWAGVTVRSPCRVEVVSGASSRSFEWVSIAYPGVVRFRRASRVEKTQEVRASTCRDSKTREIGLSGSSRALRDPEGGSRREETERLYSTGERA